MKSTTTYRGYQIEHTTKYVEPCHPDSPLLECEYWRVIADDGTAHIASQGPCDSRREAERCVDLWEATRVPTDSLVGGLSFLDHIMSSIMRIAPMLNTRQLLDMAQVIQPLDPETESLTVKQLLDLLGRSHVNTV